MACEIPKTSSYFFADMVMVHSVYSETIFTPDYFFYYINSHLVYDGEGGDSPTTFPRFFIDNSHPQFPVTSGNGITNYFVYF